MELHEFKNLSESEKREYLKNLRYQFSKNKSQITSETVNNLYPVIETDIKNRYEPFPLTDIQASYFVGRQAIRKTDRVGCHTYLEFSVNELQVERLMRAWNKLVQYHEMLRAMILPNGKQKILKEAPYYDAEVVKFSNKDSNYLSQIETVREQLSHKIYQPGDYPLFEIIITHVVDDESIVHISMDSWIVDATSASNIFVQWRQLYENEHDELPNLTISFRDYVTAAKKFEESAVYQKSLRYWQGKIFHGLTSPLLPFVDENQMTANNKRIRLTGVLPAEQWKYLQVTARNYHVSPSCLMLLLFSELLKIWSANNSFAVVTTYFNRPPIHPEINQLIGPFTSTNIFLVYNDNHKKLADKLSDYQKQIWQDLEHSHVNGVRALRDFREKRNENVTLPIVFTSLLGTDARNEDSFLNACVYSIAQTPQVFLEHQLIERAGELHYCWDVAAGAFLPGCIEAMFNDYTALIHEASGNSKFWNQYHLFEDQLKLAIKHSASVDFSDPKPTALQRAYLFKKLSNKNAISTIYQEFTVEHLSLERLNEAIKKLVDSQKILQMILTDDGKFEHLKEIPHCTVELFDISHYTVEEKQIYLEKTRAQLAKKRFSINQWPLFSINVTQQDTQQYLIHINIDMLIADGLSVMLFYKHLFAFYADENYKIYPIDEKYENAYKNILSEHAYLNYWICRAFELVEPKTLTLSESMNKERIQKRFEGKYSRWDLLKSKMEQYQVLPEAVLIALFFETLVENNEKDDFTIALALVDREKTLPEAGEVLGDFTAFSWVNRNTSASSFLDKVRYYDYQIRKDLSYRKINAIEGLRVALLKSRLVKLVKLPIVMTCAISNTDIKIPDAVNRGYGISETPDVDFDYFIFIENNALHYHWDVNVNRYSDDKIKSLFNRHNILLELLATDEKFWELNDFRNYLFHPIDEKFDLDSEKTTILQTWNATAKTYNRTICIHQLFELQVEKTPHHIAVLSDTEQFTYNSINSKANRLAHYLIDSGIHVGDKVGVCLARSVEMVITILAILKAGAAYVPLDNQHPTHRLQKIMDTAEIKTVITQAQYLHLFSREKINIVNLDGKDAANIQLAKESNPNITISSLNFAYVIFTSGSTGDPKGVLVRHRPVINLIEWVNHTFNFSENDRVLFVNPLTFDLSVYDIFGLLACGGSIRIVSEEKRKDSLYIANILINEPITFWNSAPASLQMILPVLQAKSIENISVRLIFLSGDWIPLSMPSLCKNIFPKAKLVALGGATEATVWSNYFVVEDVNPDWKSIPYGKPIQNAQYYILDQQLNLCAIGVTGDLYIGGECLSEGYINAPELTSRRFIADPFSNDVNARLYKTGDLARYYPDGNIEFLGRVDQQVKIRGYRIELGEIENAVKKLGYSQIAAVVREEMANNKYVVVFAIPENQKILSEESLIKELLNYLPDYMIPTRFIHLQLFPITENGKVDRKLLSKMPLNDIEKNFSSSKSNAFALLNNKAVKNNGNLLLKEKLQDFLISTIAKILEVGPEEVSVDKNIGHYGFNSLHYTILSVQLLEKFKFEINPTLFFKYTNIKEIIDHLLENYAESISVALQIDFQDNATRDNNQYPIVSTTRAHNDSVKENIIVHDHDVAIIGIWARLPKAENYEIFWQNLRDGYDAITEIPRERWDWKEYYGDPNAPGNKTNVKHGAFIDDMDKFDAAFFGISPREAELMDPRQRILIEGVWHMLEDAGYNPTALNDTKTALFIGATGDEFDRHVLATKQEIDSYTLTGISRTILANRLSYLFNWHGPSEVIDTACSSSLVAVHKAVQTLQSSECDFAVAGGINILLDPIPHISLSKIGMLAPDGHCKAFSKSANGYARGEGAALVFLKPLAKALSDHDSIYAVIKSTAVNHGGKANSLTAPNPLAQTRLIVEAFTKAHIEPTNIGYIEAHGTGTALGDPIEINGLKDAFIELHQKNGRPFIESNCGIGSVKSNIGHLESAAGIAGLIKIILALKHQFIPATLHAEELNPHIDLNQTPFYIATTKREWRQPSGDQTQNLLRVAGVSSFGFGGVNAHVVVEEAPVIHSNRLMETEKLKIIILSATTIEQLKTIAKNLLDYLKNNKNVNLRDMAYTLQIGRQALKTRIACVVNHTDELLFALNRYLIDDTNDSNIFIQSDKPIYFQDEEYIEFLFSKNKQHELAKLWVNGVEINWQRLYDDSNKPFRLSLPVYPFKKTSHWPVQNNFNAMVSKESSEKTSRIVRETLDSFSIHMRSDDILIKEHLINDQSLLPGATYIELLKDAAEQLIPSAQVSIKGLVWLQPLMINKNDECKLTINFSRQTPEKYLCDITDENGKKYCTTNLVIADSESSHDAVDAVNLTELKKNCDKHLSRTECYEKLNSLNINYGESFKVIKQLMIGKDGGLSAIQLVSTRGNKTSFQNTVTLLDGALQTALLTDIYRTDTALLQIPYAVDSIEFYDSLKHSYYAVVQPLLNVASNKIAKYNVLLVNENGSVSCVLKGLTARLVKDESRELLYFREAWQPIDVNTFENTVDQDILHKLDLTFFAPKSFVQEFSNVDHHTIHVNSVEATHEISNNLSCINPISVEDYEKVFEKIHNNQRLINIAFFISSRMNKDDLLSPVNILYHFYKGLFNKLIRVPINLLIIVELDQRNSINNAIYQALNSFNLAIGLENSKLKIKTLFLKDDVEFKIFQRHLMNFKLLPLLEKLPLTNCKLHFKDNILHYNKYTRINGRHNLSNAIALRKNGTYLITGAKGGLAQIFAKHLAKQQQINLALVSRSFESDNMRSFISELNTLGSRAIYYQADISHSDACEKLIADVKKQFGQINGIIHAAGILKDSLFFNKQFHAFHEVLQPKVQGTIYLDQVTADQDLDFFVMFSSLVSVMGNVGQVDYAYANEFMNQYVQAREQMRKQGLRRGRTVAINWPIWKDGGMKISIEELKRIQQLSGMVPIAIKEGLQIFDDALRSDYLNIIPIYGEAAKINRVLHSK